MPNLGQQLLNLYRKMMNDEDLKVKDVVDVNEEMGVDNFEKQFTNIKVLMPNHEVVKDFEDIIKGYKRNTGERLKVKEKLNFIKNKIDKLSTIDSETRNKQEIYVYTGIGCLLLALLGVYFFGHSIYSKIREAFKEFINNGNLGQKLYNLLKGLIWCSIITVPFILGIYFIKYSYDLEKDIEEHKNETGKLMLEYKTAYNELMYLLKCWESFIDMSATND